jgi:hypothetical protein
VTLTQSVEYHLLVAGKSFADAWIELFKGEE